ncbi:hypothetical protein LXL04_015336 [Taraxacum kok-saghyz]
MINIHNDYALVLVYQPQTLDDWLRPESRMICQRDHGLRLSPDRVRHQTVLPNAQTKDRVRHEGQKRTESEAKSKTADRVRHQKHPIINERAVQMRTIIGGGNGGTNLGHLFQFAADQFSDAGALLSAQHITNQILHDHKYAFNGTI